MLCLSDMIIGLVPIGSDVSVGHAFLMIRSDVSVGRAILMSRSDISAEEDLHGGYVYNQHEKGLAL